MAEDSIDCAASNVNKAKPATTISGNVTARLRAVGFSPMRVASLRTVWGLSLRGDSFWGDSIVPLAVEIVAGEVDGNHFGVGYLMPVGLVAERFATQRKEACWRQGPRALNVWPFSQS